MGEYYTEYMEDMEEYGDESDCEDFCNLNNPSEPQSYDFYIMREEARSLVAYLVTQDGSHLKIGIQSSIDTAAEFMHINRLNFIWMGYNNIPQNLVSRMLRSPNAKMTEIEVSNRNIALRFVNLA